MPINNEEVNIVNLLKKYRNNSCTELELQQLYHYYNVSAKQQSRHALSTAELEELEHRIWQNIAIQTIQKRAFRKSMPQHYSYAAASVLVICFLSFWWIYSSRQSSLRPDDNKQNIVQPGSNSALLTLPNGEIIAINDSSLASGKIITDQLQISKAEDGTLQYDLKDCHCDDVNDKSTLLTAQGQTMAITLPDRSKVWLNASTKLTFATNFNKPQQRQIQLEGEAFFEVANDSGRPFIVKTDFATIEVKGTSFNVNAYKNNEHSTTATVTEGIVAVSNGQQEQVRITKNQQAIINSAGIKTKKQVNTETFSSWKDGYFTFQGDVQDALSTIERWYNVKFIVQHPPKRATVYGKIARNQPLKQILDIVSESCGFHYRIQQNTVFIY